MNHDGRWARNSGGRIEFVPDGPGPTATADPPETDPAGRERVRRAGLWVAGAAMLLAAGLDVLAHQGTPVSTAAPSGPPFSSVARTPSTTPAPSPSGSPPPARHCPGRDCPDSDVPEADAIAAFAADVPGAILSSEHTVTAPGAAGRPELLLRVLRMGYGNVDMTVTITRTGSPRPAPPPRARTVLLTHGNYEFAVSTIGLYPPTGAQLRALAADPRLLTIAGRAG